MSVPTISPAGQRTVATAQQQVDGRQFRILQRLADVAADIDAKQVGLNWQVAQEISIIDAVAVKA